MTPCFPADKLRSRRRIHTSGSVNDPYAVLPNDSPGNAYLRIRPGRKNAHQHKQHHRGPTRRSANLLFSMFNVGSPTRPNLAHSTSTSKDLFTLTVQPIAVRPTGSKNVACGCCCQKRYGGACCVQGPAKGAGPVTLVSCSSSRILVSSSSSIVLSESSVKHWGQKTSGVRDGG